MVTDIQFLDIVNVLTTGVAGVVGWIVGRRKQKNDFLGELQNSIDLLAEKNKMQMEQIVNLHEDVIKLREENSQLRNEIQKLQKENARLSEDIRLLSRKFKPNNKVDS